MSRAYKGVMKTGTNNVVWRGRNGAISARGWARMARFRAQLFDFRALARGKRFDGQALTYGHTCAPENSRFDCNRPARPRIADGRAHTQFSTYGRGADLARGHGANLAFRIPHSVIVRYATAFPATFSEEP